MPNEDFEDLRSQIETLESKIEAVELKIETDIQEVRERIVQVKRETDGKAPRDHSHESLDTEFGELKADIKAIQEESQKTKSRLEGGFKNFEDILRSLIKRTEALESDVDNLHKSLKSVQQTLDTLSEREQQRAIADHLKASAVKRGIRKAKCEACRSTIYLGLLNEPTCPSCGEPFHTIDARPGFFGTSILKTRDLPALKGDTLRNQSNLEGVHRSAGEEKEEESPFLWQSLENMEGE